MAGRGTLAGVPRLLLLLLLLVGCRGAEDRGDRPLLQRYPIRGHVKWKEEIARDGRLAVLEREERWVESAPSVWDVTTLDVATQTPFYRARYALTEEGLAQTAVLDGDRVVPVNPPRLALPPRPRPGATWNVSHVVGPQRSERSCEIAAYADCRGGLEVRCTTRYGDGRKVEVKNRYCEGVGIVGYESHTDGKIHISSSELTDIP